MPCPGIRQVFLAGERQQALAQPAAAQGRLGRLQQFVQCLLPVLSQGAVPAVLRQAVQEQPVVLPVMRQMFWSQVLPPVWFGQGKLRVPLHLSCASALLSVMPLLPAVWAVRLHRLVPASEGVPAAVPAEPALHCAAQAFPAGCRTACRRG